MNETCKQSVNFIILIGQLIEDRMQQRFQTSAGLHAGSHCQHLGTSVPSPTGKKEAWNTASQREVHRGLALLVPDSKPLPDSSQVFPRAEKHASCSANYEGHSQAETTHSQVLFYASRLRSTFSLYLKSFFRKKTHRKLVFMLFFSLLVGSFLVFLWQLGVFFAGILIWPRSCWVR